MTPTSCLWMACTLTSMGAVTFGTCAPRAVHAYKLAAYNNGSDPFHAFGCAAYNPTQRYCRLIYAPLADLGVQVCRTAPRLRKHPSLRLSLLPTWLASGVQVTPGGSIHANQDVRLVTWVPVAPQIRCERVGFVSGLTGVAVKVRASHPLLPCS